MTAQELFESLLQDQADTFDLIRDDLKTKILADWPVEDVAQLIAANPEDISIAEEYLKNWVQENIIPYIEEIQLKAQQEALETAAKAYVVLNQ